MADEKKVGEITHFFTHINVAVVKFSGALNAGDKIRIKGASTDFTQTVSSMQIEHKEVKAAKKGQDIGLKVKKRCREGDLVYKV